MSDKQELVLALERFAKACQNDYVNEAVNKTEVNLKKNENVSQEAKETVKKAKVKTTKKSK